MIACGPTEQLRPAKIGRTSPIFLRVLPGLFATLVHSCTNLLPATSIRTASHQSGLRYGKERSTHIAGDSHNYAKGATRMKRRELAKAILEEIDRTRTQLARLRKVVMMKLSPKKTKGKE
jgi:hypothetical protein